MRITDIKLLILENPEHKRGSHIAPPEDVPGWGAGDEVDGRSLLSDQMTDVSAP